MNRMVLLCLLLPGLVLAGSLYRWRDHSGVLQYSAQPPPPALRQGQLRLDAGNIVYYLPVSANTIGGDVEGAGNASNDVYIGATDTASTGDSRVYCQKVRQNLRTLYEHERVRIRGGDGRYHDLDPQQKQARIDLTRQQLQSYCP